MDDRGKKAGAAVSFVSTFVSNFKKGAAEEAAELGIAERRQADRDRRRRNFTDPVKTLTAELEEDKKVLEGAAGEIESLQAERDELATELANHKEILGGVAEQAEQLKAERDQLADVLKGPGVRTLLLRTYHSDKAAKLSAAEREKLDDIHGQA